MWDFFKNSLGVLLALSLWSVLELLFAVFVVFAIGIWTDNPIRRRIFEKRMAKMRERAKVEAAFKIQEQNSKRKATTPLKPTPAPTVPSPTTQKEVPYICGPNQHTMRSWVVDGDELTETVVRWCTKCGAIRIDTDYDGRTNPGRTYYPTNPK